MLVKRHELSEGTTFRSKMPVGESFPPSMMPSLQTGDGGFRGCVSGNSSTRIVSLSCRPHSLREAPLSEMFAATGGKPLKIFIKCTGICVDLDSSSSSCSTVLLSEREEMTDCPPLCFTRSCNLLDAIFHRANKYWFSHQQNR